MNVKFLNVRDYLSVTHKRQFAYFSGNPFAADIDLDPIACDHALRKARKTN